MSKLWIDLPIELAINRGQVAAIAEDFKDYGSSEIRTKRMELVEKIFQSTDYQNSDVNWLSFYPSQSSGYSSAIAFFDIMSIIRIQPLVMPDNDEYKIAHELSLGCCNIFIAGRPSEGETVFISAMQLIRLMQESMNQAYQQSQPAIAVPQLGRFRR